MEDRNLVPYSIYITRDHRHKLKDLAKQRKASLTIRNAIQIALDEKDTHSATYNLAIDDAKTVVFENKEAQMVAIGGRDLGLILTEKLEELKRK